MILKHRHLSYFVKVAEVGQITRAALILHIAQPALSQAISQLESQLGVRLLERHPRGVSLTPAGEIFLEKAKLALEAQADAAATAASLARDLRGALQIGFLSIPPMLIAPDVLEGFAAAHPDVEISSRELRFPSGSTSSWLADVDVAFCHAPVEDPEIGILTLREDPRVVVMRADHPLAGRGELTVAEVLDEQFYGCDPSVDPAWAAFWNLDEDRGGPARVTDDRAGNTLEQVAAMASSQAISTFPASVATIIVDLVPELVALPLLDGAPAGCAVVWHLSRPSSVVSEFLEVARAIVAGGGAQADGPSIREPVVASAELAAHALGAAARPAAGARREAAVASRSR
jgi:DNA-binding transcriptional LysR family regulator